MLCYAEGGFYLNDSIGKTSFLSEASEDHSSSGILLRRLHDHSVTSTSSHGEHPQRNHGGEVEWTDTCSHTQGLAVGVCVEASGEVLLSFTHNVVADIADRFHNLQTTEHITFSISKSLALLEKRGFGDD